MRLSIILAVALAEMRSTRRLPHYWLFAVISIGIMCGVYSYLTLFHGNSSAILAGIAAHGPRYFVGLFGIFYYLWFFVGLIFLAVDIRARDERDRMSEVLDSRPLSNTEILLGRVIALVLLAWLPVLLGVLLIAGHGVYATFMNLPMGDPVESVSLVGFLLYALTTLSLWCVAIVLGALLIRNRVIVAAIALGLIGAQYWATINLPVYLTTVFSLSPAVDFSSDILPRLFRPGEGLRLFAYWVLCGALMAFAIAVYPRGDAQSPAVRKRWGLGLLLVGVGLVGFYYAQQTAPFRQGDAWLAAHEAKKDRPRPDLQSMSGTLQIRPGDSVQLALELSVIVEPPSSTLLFTLNPGLKIDGVAIVDADGEVNASWIHKDGLLEISLEEAIVGEAVLSLQASGVPDPFFGYLDAVYNYDRQRIQNSSNRSDLVLLGSQASIFDDDYVAMMPGAYWLPSTGTAVPNGEPSTHPLDFFDVDLQVEIPTGWQIAGPGKAHEVSSTDTSTRFRFNPNVPVPHVGLFASEFERRSIVAAGIEFQVLVYPRHIRNLELFQESAVLIADRLSELFSAAESLGIPYPFDSLSLVETPIYLRGYGGGWQLDTVQALPGVMMLRENSFPTVRFERHLQNPEVSERPGGIAQAKLDLIERYFTNDFTGGNPYFGVIRSFFQYQTSATGDGALAINSVLNSLTSYLVTGKHGYFSAHNFLPSGVRAGGNALEFDQSSFTDLARSHLKTITHRPAVWERALGESLAGLDIHNDPELALKSLTLKSEAYSHAILDALGREKAGRLLSALLANYRGRQFLASDLYRVAADLGIDLESIVGSWLEETSLPGFLASEVAYVRLDDDKSGTPRYLYRFQIQNAEPVPGLLQVEYEWGNDKDPIEDETDPIRIAGNSSVEVSILNPAPLRRISLHPYLSLNREAMNLRLGKATDTQIWEGDDFAGIRTSSWQASESPGITVDDLDPGFSIRRDNGEPAPRAQPGSSGFDLDHGLPEFRFYLPPPMWSRANSYNAFGKYRHTLALIAGGSGDRHAVFRAAIPKQGRWQLSYYLWVPGNPEGAPFPRFTFGKYTMTLVTEDSTQMVEFDSQAAEQGWNDLGEFALPEGDVRLEVANSTTGTVVFADAIRWVPVDGSRSPHILNDPIGPIQ